ncbi:uncharacterized protein LOC143059312 [Mytilus galloprovincialis]|uniref:uncharacterized protein LOC143059312 n=1 Tax=Mytilus galloprovincialis TaxID=29158 RepID=UPI003F7BE4E9
MSKKRSPNFTTQEIQILTDEVEKNKSLLFSRLRNTATNSAKKRGWEAVCSKMNAVNDTDHLRTVKEIRKKWTCYVNSTKKKLAENKRESRRTGGGPPPNAVSSVEEKVAGINGKTPINGIKGGIDTCVAASFEEEDSCASVSSPEKSKRLSRRYEKVERERLQIERSRYDLEKDRYNLKMQKLEIEKEKLEMEKGRYNLELSRQQLQITELCTTQPTLFQMTNPCVAINPSESSCDS